MREKRYTCGICGTERIGLDAYLDCVSKCGKKLKKEKEEAAQKAYLEEVNAAINKVKAAEKYLTEVKNDFKEKYPKEYELNFAPTCPSDCKGANKSFDTMSVKMTRNGKDKPTIDAKINGKKVDDDKLASLFDNPDVRYLAKVLGIL